MRSGLSRLSDALTRSAYNQPTNVKEWDNERRPGYHADWSFPINGAQDDIFDLSGAANTTSSIAPPVSASTGVSSTIRATAVATTSSPSASAYVSRCITEMSY
ncbi:hypothetical protein JCM10449v2_007418 [Rhodotorula kratochvilovae]